MNTIPPVANQAPASYKSAFASAVSAKDGNSSSGTERLPAQHPRGTIDGNRHRPQGRTVVNPGNSPLNNNPPPKKPNNAPVR